MLKNEIHKQIIKNNNKLHDWFYEKRRQLPLAIYTSVDVRDSGHKVACVDANIYPAGFNNICPTDKEHTPGLFKDYIHNVYGSNFKKIGLITEEHTKNAFYWENVYSLTQMIQEAGYECRILFPRDMNEPLHVESSSGHKLIVEPTVKSNGTIQFKDGYTPDLLISNYDFSDEKRDWLENIKTPINPPAVLGWYQRKKSNHFNYYNEVARELANVIQMDPWIFEIQTQVFKKFNPSDKDSLNQLANQVDEMINKMKIDYKNKKVDSQPTVFIKNNSGTYGLAVMSASSGDEVRDWNNRARTKMKAAKGGNDVSEVIVQEGIPTIVTADGYTAEPVIYIVGCELSGGFFRAHKEKSPDESLNSPGAVYKRMCVADLKLNPEDCLYENVYGWVARLSSLAIGREMQSVGLTDKFSPCT